MAHYLGLDLGGTNIKAGVIDADGKLLARTSRPTGGGVSAEPVIDALAAAARETAQQAGLTLADIAGIGIGSPGPINFATGVVVNAPNLPGFANLPLRDRVAAATGRPCVLENDANAAAFAEFYAGVGRDPKVRNLVMLTLGTGVGSGIVIEGTLVHGAFDNGGEGGHMIVVPDGRLCGCGQRGCIEAYASASHTAVRARERLATGEASSLQARFKQNPESVTAKEIFEEAQKGDALAQEIVGETARLLGIACINFCRIVDPQMIVFAGGMALAGDYLLNLIRQSFNERRWRLPPDQVQIVAAQLGNDAGLIGAAAVAADAHQRGKL